MVLSPGRLRARKFREVSHVAGYTVNDENEVEFALANSTGKRIDVHWCVQPVVKSDLNIVADCKLWPSEFEEHADQTGLSPVFPGGL